MVNIADLNHAEVLAALYNGATLQGLGVLSANSNKMTKEQAQALLNSSDDKRFDYLYGRVMKIRIADDLDTWLYNRDNGQGAAERIISDLRK